MTVLISPRSDGVRVSKAKFVDAAEARSPPWNERNTLLKLVPPAAPGPSSSSEFRPGAPVVGLGVVSLVCWLPMLSWMLICTLPYRLSEVFVPGMRNDCGKEPAPDPVAAAAGGPAWPEPIWAWAEPKPASSATVAVRLPSAIAHFTLRVFI